MEKTLTVEPIAKLSIQRKLRAGNALR